ncbi:MAG: hypothetical protein NC177_14335 [Ruminococcus flavefaciens]|nr:hypothetical protein [Ruminococcus flavefaciens]
MEKLRDYEVKVRNWLGSAFYADKKAKALDMLIRQCRERSEGLTGSGQYNYTVQSETRSNSTENAFMNLADMEQKYINQKKELENISLKISDVISLLYDDDLETVLIHRYLLFHTIEQTAEIMHYSTETVRRKTNRAIKKLCEKLLECEYDI